MMVRSLLAASLSVVCMTGLAACSGGDDSKDASHGSSSASSASASAGGTSSSSASPSAGVSKDPSKPSGGEVPPKKKGDQSNVLTSLPGSKKSTCVSTAGKRDVRSGSMGAGPFDQARKDYGKKRDGMPKDAVELYWIPRDSAKMPGLVLTGVNSDTGKRISVHSKNVGDADMWRYYNTQVRLPDPGHWRLTARSGSQQGCFELVVG
jgi:hypothetical protein